MPENVHMLEVDVDNQPDLATYFDIRKLPTFISYVGVDKTDILTGSREEDINKFFNKVEAHSSMGQLSITSEKYCGVGSVNFFN